MIESLALPTTCARPRARASPAAASSSGMCCRTRSSPLYGRRPHGRRDAERRRHHRVRLRILRSRIASRIEAVGKQDYAIVEAVAVFISALFILTSLVVDLLYGVLDPGSNRGARG